MNKPNGQRFWYPPSINHSSVCQKPGGPVVWIQSALWHYLDEDRYYPVHGPVPQCWRWTPISPAWRWSFPRITQSVLPWSPSNNIALWIFIALFSFSGILYQKKAYSLYGGNTLFPCFVSYLSLTSDLYQLLHPRHGLWSQLFFDYLLSQCSIWCFYIWPFGLEVIQNW